jgi:hypothetical protein
MDLTTLERDSSNLIELFQFRPVPKQTWLLFESLTKRTDEHSRMYVSYFQQWLSVFPVEIEKEDIAGISPDVWVYLYQEWGIKSASRWIDVEVSIKNELLKAMNQSLDWVNSTEFVKANSEETMIDTEEREISAYPSITKVQVVKQKKKQSYSQNESIWVPVVEELIGFVEKHHFSRLRKLECRIENFGVQSQQRLVLDLPGGNSAEDDEVLKTIGRLAQKRLISEHQLRFNVDATFRFMDRSGVHSGKSYGAAAYAILLCSSLKKGEQPKKYVVLEHVAMTGYPDEHGYLIDLDEEGLKSKLKGCFYSWINTFVVPETQVQLCRAYLDELEEKWPNKKLALIGIRHIDEIFDNRRITGLKQTPKVIIQTKKIWQKSKSFLVVILSLLLLLLGFQSIYGPFDKHAELVTGSGEFYEVRNEAGDILMKIKDHPNVISGNFYSLYKYYSLLDVDGDGFKELILASTCGDPVDLLTKNCIKVYSVKTKQVIWEYHPEHTIKYPKIMGANDSHTQIFSLISREFKGKKEIYIQTILSGSFNSQLIKVDYDTKEVLQRYVHPGMINSYEFVDMTNDGKDELVICAINNAWYGAGLIVLDPENMDGNGPTRGDYISDYPGKVKHIAYLLIENSKLANSVLPTKYPTSYFGWFKRPSFYSLNLSDVQYENSNVDVRSFWNSYATFILNFDFDLKPISVLTTDFYDIVAKQMVEEGRLDAMPDYDYWVEYMNTKIRYWNGESFQKEVFWQGRKK